VENEYPALKDLLQGWKKRIVFLTQPGGIMLEIRKDRITYFGPLTSAPRKDDLVVEIEPEQALRLVSGEFQLLPQLMKDGASLSRQEESRGDLGIAYSCSGESPAGTTRRSSCG